MAALLLLAVGEVVGRAIGLHTPVIYETTGYGYRIVPDQDIHRFGRHAYYNAQGMRSPPRAERPAAGCPRILFLGDSVTNGAVHIDQADTYPYVVEALLRRRLPAVETMNASAPGWATGNELGWLRQYGVFGSRVVVLTLSSHDLYQEDAPATIVGRHPSFPDHRPLLALADALDHYLLPYLTRRLDLADPGAENSEPDPKQIPRTIANVSAIDEAVRAGGASLLVVFLEEGGRPGDEGIRNDARRAFLAEMAERGVPVLAPAASIEGAGRDKLFFDQVHPNPAGNRLIGQLVAERLGSVIEAGASRAAAGGHPEGR